MDVHLKVLVPPYGYHKALAKALATREAADGNDDCYLSQYSFHTYSNTAGLIVLTIWFQSGMYAQGEPAYPRCSNILRKKR